MTLNSNSSNWNSQNFGYGGYILSKCGDEYEFIIKKHIDFVKNLQQDEYYEYYNDNGIISLSHDFIMFGYITHSKGKVFHNLNHPAKIWSKVHSIKSCYEWWLYGKNRTNDVEKWLIENGYKTNIPLTLEQIGELKLHFME